MGNVIPLRPKLPKAKSRAEKATWRIWQPIGGPFVFSFDRWRAAEIVRVASSRKSPGIGWVDPFACHLDHLARRLDPVPDEGEIGRVITRLVGLVVPITSGVLEQIDAGRGRYRPRAFDLALELGVSPGEKIRFGLRTIRDVTETTDVMRARRLARRRAREAEKRRAAGREPQPVRAMRARMARRLAELADISDPTARKWLKTAESEGSLVVATVTSLEFERHVLGVLNRMQGRTNLKSVTPSAERKRRSRAKLKAEGAPDAPVAAAVVPTETAPPTVATLAADALTLPVGDVSFDPDRRVICVSFRPVRPAPSGFDPSPVVGNILAMAGWTVRSTAFDGEVVEIGIGEAA